MQDYREFLFEYTSSLLFDCYIESLNYIDGEKLYQLLF